VKETSFLTGGLSSEEGLSKKRKKKPDRTSKKAHSKWAEKDSIKAPSKSGWGGGKIDRGGEQHKSSQRGGERKSIPRKRLPTGKKKSWEGEGWRGREKNPFVYIDSQVSPQKVT